MPKVTLDVKVVLEMDLAEAQALSDELGQKTAGSKLVYGIFDVLSTTLETLPVKGVE